MPAVVIARKAEITCARIAPGARVVRTAVIGETLSGPPIPKKNIAMSATGSDAPTVSSQSGALISTKPSMPSRSGFTRRASHIAPTPPSTEPTASAVKSTPAVRAS